MLNFQGGCKKTACRRNVDLYEIMDFYSLNNLIEIIFHFTVA